MDQVGVLRTESVANTWTDLVSVGRFHSLWYRLSMGSVVQVFQQTTTGGSVRASK